MRHKVTDGCRDWEHVRDATRSKQTVGVTQEGHFKRGKHEVGEGARCVQGTFRTAWQGLAGRHEGGGASLGGTGPRSFRAL